jgi:hypothetical protein
MSIQGESNEFLTLLFGEINEKRFAQVIKVKSKIYLILISIIFIG